MGAWGAGILENDYALDFVAHWEKYIAPSIDSKAWDAEITWSFLRDLYFGNRFNLQDTAQNAEILALAVLFHRHSLELPEGLKQTAESAVNSELRAAALGEWEDSKARKRVLLELLSSIGGEQRTVSKAELGSPTIAAEIEKLLPFTRKFSRWAKTVTIPRDDDEFEKLYPAFFDQLDRLLIAGMPQPRAETDEEARLIKLRLMLIAFYAAWKARCSASEIVSIVKQAGATNGYIWINVEIFGDRPGS